MRILNAVISTSLIAVAGLSAGRVEAETSYPGTFEWRSHGGSHAFDRYSPVSIINRSNVGRLKVMWVRPGLDASLRETFPDLIGSNRFNGTPIMVGGVLYASNAVGLVEAFDPTTGRTKWVQRPFDETIQEAAGVSSRNVEYWESGQDRRIFSVKGEYLYALDAATGKVVPTFGEKGRVLLRRDTPEGNAFRSDNSLIVVGDSVIVGGLGGISGGNTVGDGEAFKEGVPEDVRAYDARTGKQIWTFHVMPQVGNPARATWGKGSANIVGNMGNWANMAADDERNIVYVPLSSMTNPSYGGHRPGDNLYSNSLVALNASTGKLLWHFQMVHHDLWDYEPASPPTLATLRVGGRTIDAVIQPNKNGFLYVFDRITGKPVWPIIERPVPQSSVPGEVTSPTQPFPTKPPAISPQAITADYLNDLTPAIHEEAKSIASRFNWGPLYTPPTVKGVNGKDGALEPFVWGAANWATGALDPRTGRYYASSMAAGANHAVAKNNDLNGIEYPLAYGGSIYPQGLPLVKPPWGRITAYDMNKGDQLWTVANADGPKDHPALKGLDLPPLGIPAPTAVLVTGSLLFLAEPSAAQYIKNGVRGPAAIRAFDKDSGRAVATAMLPAGVTGALMTYAVDGKQFIIAPVGDAKFGNGWVALGVDR